MTTVTAGIRSTGSKRKFYPVFCASRAAQENWHLTAIVTQTDEYIALEQSSSFAASFFYLKVHSYALAFHSHVFTQPKR